MLVWVRMVWIRVQSSICTVKNNLDQNTARIWITPHYAVIAGYLSDGSESILEMEENPEISGFSKKLPNI